MQSQHDRTAHTIHAIPMKENPFVQCEIFVHGAQTIPQDQLITALWEAAETYTLDEIHREQIVLNLYEPQGMLTFSNRFRQTDGSLLSARLHVCVQQGERGQSIQGYIESGAPHTCADMPLLITYLAPFAATLQPVVISPQIETLLGFALADWRSTPDLWARQLHPADRERVLAERQQCYTSEQPFCSEYRMLAFDGQAVWLREEATPVANGCQYPQYMQGLLLDISLRKQYEQQYHVEQPSVSMAGEDPDSKVQHGSLLSQAVGQ
jgi:hypothetical protein